MSIQFIALVTGAAAGPLVAALLHDTLGNYHLLLGVNAATFVVAGALPMFLREYLY